MRTETTHTIEMILMTRSSKYGEYCVAGFECGTGRYIRLISDNEQTRGAISAQMLYDPICGRCADVLDRVRVRIIEERPDRVQRENVLMDTAARIRIIGQVTIQEAMRLHPCEIREALFRSHQPIVETAVEELGHSLEFVRAEKVRIYRTFGTGGKPRHKIDFECGGRSYSGFAMTDPVYYATEEKHIPQAALMLSISDDEWSRSNGHYTYIAAVFNLRFGTKRKKKAGRLKRMLITAAVLCSIIGLCAALSLSNKVYVPPYSGARYHVSASCSRLPNAESAYRMPQMLAGIFFAPCAECAVSK